MDINSKIINHNIDYDIKEKQSKKLDLEIELLDLEIKKQKAELAKLSQKAVSRDTSIMAFDCFIREFKHKIGAKTGWGKNELIKIAETCIVIAKDNYKI